MVFDCSENCRKRDSGIDKISEYQESLCEQCQKHSTEHINEKKIASMMYFITTITTSKKSSDLQCNLGLLI